MKTSTSSPAAAPRSAPRVALVCTKAAAARLSRSLEDEGVPVVAGVRAVKELEPNVATSADAVVVHVPDARDDPAARVRALRRLAPSARIVVVAPSLNVRQLRVLVDAGVDAFVLEGDAAESLGAAVRSVCAGLLAFPASLRQTLVAPVLSTREKQVLGLVVLGLTNAEIARKLHLAESTVKSHLSSSFTKLGARSRNEATALILDPATGLGTGILAISDGR